MSIPVSCIPDGPVTGTISNVIACGGLFGPPAGSDSPASAVPTAAALPPSPNTSVFASLDGGSGSPPPAASESQPGGLTGLPAVPTGTDFRLSPFVITASEGPIAIPAQTGVITDGLYTSVLSGMQGPAGSFAAVTTTDASGSDIILPIWWPIDGPAIEIIPPPGHTGGIIGPPGGGNLPTLAIGPDGQPKLIGTPKPNVGVGGGGGGNNVDPKATGGGGSSRGSSGPPGPGPGSNGGDGSGGGDDGDQETATQSSESSTTTSTTSEATFAPTPFLVIPNGRISKDQKAAIRSALDDKVGSKNVESIDDPDSGPVVWRAALNSTGVDFFKKSFGLNGQDVNDVVADAPSDDFDDDTGTDSAINQKRHSKTDWRSTNKRDIYNPIFQPFADQPLSSISQTPAEAQQGILDLSYTYSDTAGRGSTVFIIDSGINEQHSQFQQWNADAYYRFFDATADGRQTLGDPVGHGSCLFTQVASPGQGVAKKTNVVNMKVPTTINSNGKPRFESIYDLVRAVGLAADTIEQFGMQSQAVVLTAWSLLGERMPNGTLAVLKNQFQRLENLDTLVVASIGNQRPGPIRTFPQLWNGQGNFKNIISVGATGFLDLPQSYNSGRRDSNGNLDEPSIDVFAPGDVACINHDENLLGFQYGTSFAAGHVAGLAAYLLQAPNRPVGAVNLKQRIIDLSYARTINGPKIAYNGIHLQLAAIACNGNGDTVVAHTAIPNHIQRKRDGAECPFETMIPTTFLTATRTLTGINPSVSGVGASRESTLRAASAPPTTMPPPPPTSSPAPFDFSGIAASEMNTIHLGSISLG